jgi:HAD superfamily hydrolase (TIGR01509 family)
VGVGVSGLGALVLDFDGLILDTETSEYVAANAVFVEHGVELDRAEWQAIIGRTDHPHWSDMLEAALGRPLEDRESLVVRHRDLHRVQVAAEKVRPGVAELLEEAAAAGVPAAVASSSGWDWVGDHVERLGLRHLFAHVVTRDDVGGDTARTKPRPDLYLIAAERLGVAPATCVAFEDSPHGAVAAHAAGMTVVAVPGPMTEGLDFPVADRVLPSLDGVRLADLRAWVAARHPS